MPYDSFKCPPRGDRRDPPECPRCEEIAQRLASDEAEECPVCGADHVGENYDPGPDAA
jgi:hypothetical protein